MRVHGVRTNGLSLAVLSVAAVAALAAVRPDGGPVDAPDGLVVTAAGWVAWVVAVYAAGVLATAGAVAAWRGQERLPALLSRLAPPVVRRVLASALTVGVVSAPATGALAGDNERGRSASSSAGHYRGDPRLGPLVDRPDAGLRITTPSGVTVRPGECLWSIAAGALPGRPSDARVAREWPRWWRANRGVIGADPDLIHPGDVLTPPPAARRSVQ